MNGYAAAVRQFYDIYRPIARRYGLRMSSHTSIYDQCGNARHMHRRNERTLLHM